MSPRRKSRRNAGARRIPHVLLLIESSRAYGRGCLTGIAAYLRAHGPWHVLHLERGLQEDVPPVIRGQRIDGVIARMENPRIARSVARLGAPTVDLRGSVMPERGVTLDTDPRACAEMAIAHFRERGFRDLAWCGYPGVDFSDRRRQWFVSSAIAAGLDPAIYNPPVRQGGKGGTLSREARGELDEPQIAAWLTGLRRPVGVFACNDVRGRQVVRAAAMTGLRVPDEVAVLGVDNDEVICDLANPPLSSIEPDTYGLGFEGAAALAMLMGGEVSSERKLLVPPRRIAVRRSTDVLAVDDVQVAEALRFIRAHACEGIGVEKVVGGLSISRATLERRFRSVIGRSPRQEIERVRYDRIRLLLAETRYTLDRIAPMAGYRTAAHLVTAFSRRAGCTPGEFRRRAAGQTDGVGVG